MSLARVPSYVGPTVGIRSGCLEEESVIVLHSSTEPCRRAVAEVWGELRAERRLPFDYWKVCSPRTMCEENS